ncbi:BRO-N domain-containing protein [Arsenophonus sp. PmNCSU2021_1]|uniref:BRO-N domain-containing protein n=1 Tax=Arsenophonus sp. PmNCSU2021_1 TaxID=3118989 RepID=UPI002FF3A5B2
MSALSINSLEFTFENHSIRTIIIENEPWFVAVDVCNTLGIKNTTDSLKVLDKDERSRFNLGRQGESNIINESGLYTIILRCRDAVKQGTLPHRFRKWVTNEVLPSIRKTGKYEHPQTRPEAPELLNDNDTRNLAHLVWSMANGFRFERAWT